MSTQNINQTEKTDDTKDLLNQSASSNFEKYSFFSKEEIAVFLSEYSTIILHMDNGTPYINYDTAKTVFESVVGGNYSLEILSHEFIPEQEVYMVHVRFTLVRGDKKISREVIGCEKAKKSKDTGEIVKFENLAKSAVKDAFKKFLSDYIGIGSHQFSIAKKAHEEKFKNKSNTNQNIQNDNKIYNCEDCGATINSKVYNFSKLYHSEKRPLCTVCQKKY